MDTYDRVSFHIGLLGSQIGSIFCLFVLPAPASIIMGVICLILSVEYYLELDSGKGICQTVRDAIRNRDAA